MHILIIHQAFASFDEPGGTRHYEFARLLNALGHKITIIASPVSYITGEKVPFPLPASCAKMEPEQERGEIRILRANVYSAHHKSFPDRVVAFFSFMLSSFILGLKVKQVNLVWGTSPPIFQGVTAWALSRIKRVPFLFEVRDLWPQFAIAVGVLRNPILIRLSEWLERFLYHVADRVMVNSPGFISHVQTRGARLVELIPNGADPEMFDPQDDGSAFRKAHGLKDKFVALYAGAHGLSNDLGVVLEAANLLANTNIHIVLVGDGKEKPALQLRAKEMGLTNVIFASTAPKSEIPTVLAGADACIAILKPLEEYKITYPNKVFDYMAAGRPIALAIDGMIREVVEAAGCGLFAKPGDAAALADVLQKLARDKTRARRMGLQGRGYLEKHFNRAEIVEKLAGLLNEMTQ